jgi:membrane fusion protein (multidrug efflux system)
METQNPKPASSSALHFDIMPTAFTRTMRGLEADSFSRAVSGMLAAILLLGAWGAWGMFARVARYETTDSARLEVDRATYVLQADSPGRVVVSNLVLGREVEAGDVLVELDANPARLELAEQIVRRTMLDPQLESLRAELSATLKARGREQEANLAAMAEARARIAEAEPRAVLAETEAARTKQLLDQGLTTERENARAHSESRQAHAAVETLRQVLARLEREQRTRETDRETHSRGLEAQIRRLEGDKTTAASSIARLQYEAERRKIRAPISGRLGEVATLRPGAVLEERDKIGSIVPHGKLRIVAEFPAAAAMGRIRPGQSARLRLKGFPWAQYGSISGRVSTVANEIRDGTVRVECDLVRDAPADFPAQHGLMGTVEVQVEEVSPAALVLRAAGGLVAAPRSAF